MSASLWSQIDTGVAFALGAIVETAAIRKLQRPRVFRLTLDRLEPALGPRTAAHARSSERCATSPATTTTFTRPDPDARRTIGRSDEREVPGHFRVRRVEVHLGFGPAREPAVTPAHLDVTLDDAFGAR